MSDEEEDELPPECLFFKRRAQLVPHVSPEDFQTVSEQLSKAEKETEFLGSNQTKPNKKTNTKNGAKITKTINSVISDGIPVEVEDTAADALSREEVKLPRAVMRRLKKLQDERARELKMIEKANEQVFAATESPIVGEIEEICVEKYENSIALTVSYMSKIARLRCYENEKFATIFPKIADLYKLKASELLLCLREQNISVDDTPKSLNITLDDTIECIPYKLQESNKENEDENELKLVFQSSDSKQKIDLLAHKLEKMQEIMERYANLRKLPLKNLIFEFDGERIEGTETPNELDMESGHCIDVKVVENLNKRKRTPPSKRSKRIYSTKNEPDVVTVVTDESNDSDIMVL